MHSCLCILHTLSQTQRLEGLFRMCRTVHLIPAFLPRNTKKMIDVLQRASYALYLLSVRAALKMNC